MRTRTITLLGAAVALAALSAMPVSAAPQGGGWSIFGGQNDRGAYDRGYREGLRDGEQDLRSGRGVDLNRHSAYRNADAGYARRDGNRDDYRRAFRNGFEDGYRSVYQQARGNGRRGQVFGRTPRGGYQDPASARGYSDGYEHGIDDGHDRDRYDPVRHGDYKSGDDGYNRSYGSKDSYRNNYRAGFRQGYEDGYRSGTRQRR